MPISFYDDIRNSPGVLSAKLAVDIGLIKSLTTTVMGVIVMSMSSFIAGPVISFVFSWELTLVSLVITPLIVFASAVQAK